MLQRLLSSPYCLQFLVPMLLAYLMLGLWLAWSSISFWATKKLPGAGSLLGKFYFLSESCQTRCLKRTIRIFGIGHK